VEVCAYIWCQVFYGHQRFRIPTTTFFIIRSSAIYFNITHTPTSETHFSIHIFDPKGESSFVGIIFGIDEAEATHLPSARFGSEEKGKIFCREFAWENILYLEFEVVCEEVAVEDALET
jgi:hypothetical protein